MTIEELKREVAALKEHVAELEETSREQARTIMALVTQRNYLQSQGEKLLTTVRAFASDDNNTGISGRTMAAKIRDLIEKGVGAT